MPAASIYRHPKAGYLLDFAHGADPGPLDPNERTYLRGLASLVAELALQPQQSAKREEWYRHNALGKGRPLLLLFPENSWEEILPETAMRVHDPFWRNQEWYLRNLLYRAEHFADDFCIERELVVPWIIRRSGWGVQGTITRSTMDKGAYKLQAPLVEPEDIETLVLPTTWVDEGTTLRYRDALGELLGDLLPVKLACFSPHANIIGEAAGLRNVEQLMVDMYDRPEWVHRLMDMIATAVVNEAEYLESHGYLTLNNHGEYNDSGAIGYSRELPAADFDGTHVRLKDLWGFGVAQELSLVGPAQHDEFVLQYQLRLLERCGLNAYGCCEPYTRKYDMLTRIPRLRRVSVSPWSDLKVSADHLGDHCIFSWKPNPAMLANEFDPDYIRRYIRETLDIARDCRLEMILKDTITVCNQPERLDIWSRIAREEIERSN
ncbi:MAG: hypothetical protein ACYCZF_11500 [Anaerolineae bacterium]